MYRKCISTKKCEFFCAWRSEGFRIRYLKQIGLCLWVLRKSLHIKRDIFFMNIILTKISILFLAILFFSR